MLGSPKMLADISGLVCSRIDPFPMGDQLTYSIRETLRAIQKGNIQYRSV